ncbi:hypothetical protein HELRODRAFT_175212 [Helobdella robusta]|uniref:Uncharacterized protein n=1 Tax=Helobdella robusta TaxID=6412 RepID=T1F907_HELRO|nr:hypothetical protein HELRODRAFT_175212 [Helobdella robusta]ESO01184.1 hypothetical protein HELRODRAFT_175212 [Helobdella robusta]
MTTVEYGGGANLQQRKEFCELDDGAKIPGYKGYCPSLKFTFGKTFAKSTRDISSENKKDYNNNNNNNNANVYSRMTAKQQQQLLHPNVPENNGRNKYSKDMVSGYTGFIPKCSTKFGKTYREECEKCFSEHFHDLELYKDRRNRNKMTSQQTSGLQASHRKNKEEILRSINEYTDSLTFNGAKKPLIEAPIIGYTGFVPKKNTTELGLGASYGRAAEKSLEKFDLETNAYKNKIAFLENNVTCCCRYK